MSNPCSHHWQQLSKIGRYLLGKPRLVLKFPWQEESKMITTYTDSDWAGCVKTARSTSGGILTMGGHVIKTYAKQQKVIALSSAEAELYAMVAASAESLLGGKSSALGKGADLLPVDQAFQLQGATRRGHEIALDWSIAPGYYLYRHSLKVSVDAPAKAPFAGPELPKGVAMNDAEFGNVEIYRGSLQAKLTLPADAAAPRTLRVKYQGCADIGVCYPPQTRLVAVK